MEFDEDGKIIKEKTWVKKKDKKRKVISNLAERILQREVELIPGRKKYTDTGVEIQCPFHPSDNTPSCGIITSRTVGKKIGSYFCLGCKASGPWGKIAKKFGLRPIMEDDDRVDSIEYDETRLTESMNTYFSNKDITRTVEQCCHDQGFNVFWDWQEETPWRGIPGYILSALSVKTFFDSHNTKFILFPVTIFGHVESSFRARVEKEEGKQSYLIEGGAKSQEIGLFPFDIVRSMLASGEFKSLVLVEGQRDALRLIANGIPAVAILGSKSWSKVKLNLVLKLNVSVVICMDGDYAGVTSTRMIQADFDKYRIQYKVMDLSKESVRLKKKLIKKGKAKFDDKIVVDPNNMSKHKLKQLLGACRVDGETKIG